MPVNRYYYRYIHSLLHKHWHCRRAIQQIHLRLIVLGVAETGLLALWNSLLKHYALSVFPKEALLLFKYLRAQSCLMCFDSFTYAYSIKACGNMEKSRVGRQFHCLSWKLGFDPHVHVQTALVNMYLDCGCLPTAKNVFDEMPQKNLVTWNVLLTGFIKWGDVDYARSIFDVMPEKNVISWTGLIDGYTRANRYDEALLLFRKMVVHEGIKPTEVTLLAIYPTICNIGCIEFCRLIHAYGVKSGLNASDVRVVNCLIDAYAKSGSIENASRVFEEMVDARRNLFSWTSIISGFAMHGMVKEAVDCYRRMENEGHRPNWVTFLSVLNACSHGGLVEEGLEFYGKMVGDYKIKPTIKHYGTLIDMLGRAGRLEEAEKMALSIPMEHDNVVIWRTLLGACSFHGNVEMGERITQKIMEMERKYGGDYVLLSNIFSAAGRFGDSERIRNAMFERDAARVPGITLV